MSDNLLETGINVLQAIRQLSQRIASDVSDVKSWRSILLRLFALWFLFSLVKTHVADFWYSFNFRESWTAADYPPLCSDNHVKLLPWMSSEYPALKSPDSNIRLLQIQPSHPIWGIEATLECSSFLERPQYRALSYTWGDSTRKKPITVNGKKMLITENLWKALFHIRDRQRPQTLWVDAISINQDDDDEEKSIQVPLMSFIFSRAREVIVWLGDHQAPRWVEHGSSSQWHGNWATSKATVNWPVTKYWLYLLASEEYWKRCWIVQEIAMASTIRVYSGHSTIPWMELMKLMRLHKSKVPLDSNAIDNVLRLETLREAKYFNGDAYSLDRLLEQFSDCFCSVALDKIFAFLGMASDCLEGCIKVDYSMSLLQVYQELVFFWDSRCFRIGDEAVGTVYFASLVRSILSRRWAPVPRTLSPPSLGESADSFGYFLCGEDRAEFCDLVPKLRSLLSYVDQISSISNRLISYLFTRGSEMNSLWLPAKPEDSRVWTPKTPADLDANRSPVSIRGSVAGVVCELGPTYREFIERFTVPRRWASRLGTIWGLACNETSMRSAKAINERLAMLLGPGADYRMRNFVSLENDTPYSFYSSRLFMAFGPRREVIMGLAPWETLPGDVLIQFWNTDAVLVARKEDMSNGTLLVGRAGIVKDGEITNWHVPTDRDAFDHPSELIFNHLVTVSTLTHLSFDTVCLPGTALQQYEEVWELSKQTWTSHDFEMKDVAPFSDGGNYDNNWDAPRTSHVDEIGPLDIERSCFTDPCQTFVSKTNTGTLFLGRLGG